MNYEKKNRYFKTTQVTKKIDHAFFGTKNTERYVHHNYNIYFYFYVWVCSI